MAKEKNGTAVATETMNGNLVLVRDPITDKNGKQFMTKDGRPYYSYVVRGKVRGEEKKVDFVPKDQGGYEPLDILFEIAPKAELIISEEVMVRNDETERHEKRYVYATFTVGSALKSGFAQKRDRGAVGRLSCHGLQ